MCPWARTGLHHLPAVSSIYSFRFHSIFQTINKNTFSITTTTKIKILLIEHSKAASELAIVYRHFKNRLISINKRFRIVKPIKLESKLQKEHIQQSNLDTPMLGKKPKPQVTVQFYSHIFLGFHTNQRVGKELKHEKVNKFLHDFYANCSQQPNNKKGKTKQKKTKFTFKGPKKKKRVKGNTDSRLASEKMHEKLQILENSAQLIKIVTLPSRAFSLSPLTNN